MSDRMQRRIERLLDQADAAVDELGASAGGGEILVSSLLAQLVEPSGEFEPEERPELTFKGLEGKHVTYSVGWTGADRL